MSAKPLFEFAHDGKLFHTEVRRRLAQHAWSMNALCEKAGISFSTTDRWKNGSIPEVPTVRLVAKILREIKRPKKFEHSLVQHVEA